MRGISRAPRRRFRQKHLPAKKQCGGHNDKPKGDPLLARKKQCTHNYSIFKINLVEIYIQTEVTPPKWAWL